ncbi:hypothetical protein GQ457_06G037940 [Hibiscus cannabinus]
MATSRLLAALLPNCSCFLLLLLLRLRPFTSLSAPESVSGRRRLHLNSFSGNSARQQLQICDGIGIFITLKLASWSKIPYAEL